MRTEVLNVMTMMAILCIMFQVDRLFQVTMWYFDIKSRSLCICVFCNWIEVDPQVSDQALRFARLLRCPNTNLSKTYERLWATSSMFPLLPPCLLSASVWCPASYSSASTLCPLQSLIKPLLASNQPPAILFTLCTSASRHSALAQLNRVTAECHL